MSTATSRAVTPLDFLRTSPARDTVDQTYAEYAALHDRGGAEARRSAYATMVNAYYDLVTDFYEFGWGDAFHFAPRYRGESFLASLARHQHFLARWLRVEPGDAVTFNVSVTAPDTRRTAVNEAASACPPPSAARHSNEFAAKPISAAAARSAVRGGPSGEPGRQLTTAWRWGSRCVWVCA